jgi:hypothetical protein
MEIDAVPVAVRIDPRSSAAHHISTEPAPLFSPPADWVGTVVPWATRDFLTLSVPCPTSRKSKRLRGIQERRARQEGEEAERVSEPAEREAHERRADKAAYLRDRLEDQAAAPDQ